MMQETVEPKPNQSQTALPVVAAEVLEVKVLTAHFTSARQALWKVARAQPEYQTQPSVRIT